MKNHWSPHLPLVLLVLLFLAACDVSPPPAPPQPAAAVEEATPERAETKGLEAASLVGYDGKRVRKGVDKTLNNNDEHNQQLEQTLKESGNQ